MLEKLNKAHNPRDHHPIHFHFFLILREIEEKAHNLHGSNLGANGSIEYREKVGAESNSLKWGEFCSSLCGLY